MFFSVLSKSVLALTFVSSMTLSYAKTVEHAQGTAEVPESVDTVLAFDFATLDTLNELGVEVAGIPKAVIPPRFTQYGDEKYANLGSLFEPDFETVASLQADVIFVANRSSTSYKELSRLAPTIDLTIDSNDFINGHKKAVSTIADIFGRSAEAEARLAKLDDKLAHAQELAKTAGKALVLMSNGGKLAAFGDQSRFGWLYKEMHVEPAITDFKKGRHGDPVSFEYLLEVDPDMIFVIDRDAAIQAGGSSASSTLDNDLVKRTKAYKNDRIVYLDSANWYIVMSGLSTVEMMVDEVITGLEH
ncbi:siderophore ABC transporter substrate-binding protein [Marinomonas epiphytica]